MFEQIIKEKAAIKANFENAAIKELHKLGFYQEYENAYVKQIIPNYEFFITVNFMVNGVFVINSYKQHVLVRGYDTTTNEVHDVHGYDYEDLDIESFINEIKEKGECSLAKYYA